MLHTFKISLSRETLHSNFTIEPQEINTEAPISARLLKIIEQKINDLLIEKECFKLSITVTLDITTYVNKQLISKTIKAAIVNAIDYYDNNLLQKPIDLGIV